jgi:hypothetical protein
MSHLGSTAGGVNVDRATATLIFPLDIFWQIRD